MIPKLSDKDKDALNLSLKMMRAKLDALDFRDDEVSTFGNFELIIGGVNDIFPHATIQIVSRPRAFTVSLEIDDTLYLGFEGKPAPPKFVGMALAHAFVQATLNLQEK